MFYFDRPDILLRYGAAAVPLPRKVIKRGYAQPSLELHPPELQVIKLISTEEFSIGDAKPVLITVSCVNSLNHCCKMMLEALKLGNTPGSAFRIWRLEREKIYKLGYSTQTLLNKGGELVDLKNASSKTVYDTLIATGDVFAVEIPDESGKWLVDEKNVPNIGGIPKIDGETKELEPLFGSGTDFFSNLGSSTSGLNKKANGSILKPAADITSSSSGSSASSNVIKLKIAKRSAGATVGLQNMYVFDVYK